jgi:hypothetical protein
MTVNTIMAANVLRSIVSHPDEHNQNSWFDFSHGLNMSERKTIEFTLQDALDENEEALCGTTACAAGWAVMHDGWTVKNGIAAGLDSEPLTVVISKGDQTLRDPDFDEMGADLLGLSSREANLLFLIADDTEAVAALYVMATKGRFDKTLFESGCPIDIDDYDSRDEYKDAVAEWDRERFKRIDLLVSSARIDYREKVTSDG